PLLQATPRPRPTRPPKPATPPRKRPTPPRARWKKPSSKLLLSGSRAAGKEGRRASCRRPFFVAEAGRPRRARLVRLPSPSSAVNPSPQGPEPGRLGIERNYYAQVDHRFHGRRGLQPRRLLRQGAAGN